jgi:hypothetical protein
MMEEDMISFVIYSVQCNNYGSTSSPPQSVGLLSGLSASPPMVSSTGLVARMVLSSCGKRAASPTDCGGQL